MKYIDVDKLNSLIDNKLEDLGMSGSVWVGRSVLCELKDEIKSLEQEQSEVCKGWIAKNGVSNDKTYMYVYDNNIIFSEIKPTRDEYYKHWNPAKFYLSPKAFPNLKWEDEPIEVELIIRNVKKEE